MKKPKQLQQSQNPSTIALTNWNLNQTSKAKAKAKQKPREQSPTIAFVLPSATNLGMGFPIRPYRVLLRALIAFPLLHAMFHTEMLLYPREIAQSS